jgi:ferredoxin
MKAIVDKELCIGCGLCASTCPDVFEMEGALATVKIELVPATLDECTKKAAEECPVVAITIE